MNALVTCGDSMMKIVAGRCRFIDQHRNALTSTLQVVAGFHDHVTRSLLQVVADPLQVFDLRLQVVAGSLQVGRPIPRCRSGRGVRSPPACNGRGAFGNKITN